MARTSIPKRKLKELIDKKMSATEIAKEFGVAVSTICNAAKAHGINVKWKAGDRRKNGRYSEEDVRLFLALVNDEMPVKLAAKKMEISYSAARQIARGTRWAHI